MKGMKGMKGMKKIFVMILAAGIGIACAHAQQRAVVERKIGTTVFVEDTTKMILQNKENKISQKTHFSTASVTVMQYWEDIYEKVFSKERAEQLTDVRLVIFCYLDSASRVREVKFYIPKGYNKLTLSEFQAMEERFKAGKFKITNFVKDKQDGEEGFIQFMIPCYFKRMHKKRPPFPSGGI
jgi:hypothetical protein